MRDQQSSDTSIALDANTDVIVIALCAGASALTIKRIK